MKKNFIEDKYFWISTFKYFYYEVFVCFLPIRIFNAKLEINRGWCS